MVPEMVAIFSLWLGRLALAAAILCALQAVRLLIFRRPARAQVVYDGYRRWKTDSDGAWFRGQPPDMDATITDRLVFDDEEGRTIRLDVQRRPARADPRRLVWYDPRNPERAAAVGPHIWATWAVAFAAFFASVGY